MQLSFQSVRKVVAVLSLFVITVHGFLLRCFWKSTEFVDIWELTFISHRPELTLFLKFNPSLSLARSNQLRVWIDLSANPAAVCMKCRPGTCFLLLSLQNFFKYLSLQAVLLSVYTLGAPYELKKNLEIWQPFFRFYHKFLRKTIH